MNSTKRYLPMLAVGFVFFLSGTLTAQNQDFPSNLGWRNPCNSAVVQVSGPTKIVYQQNANADGTGGHVVVHLTIQADGQDDSQDSGPNPYRTNLEANGQFDSVASSYNVPFHSVWVGQQGAPSFTLNGLVNVDVSGTTPVSSIVPNSLTDSCTN